MKRKYWASFDNGHDYFSLEFESEYRAGSKANKEDAMKELRRKYGKSIARGAEIICIYRWEY